MPLLEREVPSSSDERREKKRVSEGMGEMVGKKEVELVLHIHF